ncbi:MAG: alternative ribosome rescue aminoacyl-tRNA hydrolase ArfB [Pseudomonadota bacterium]
MPDDKLIVSATISIDERDLVERFVRASGPGGQNVNKVATAVELRFDAARAPALSPAVRARLARVAGRRMTEEGVIVIRAERFRTQEQNRADARSRLVALIRESLVTPKPRIATKPSRGAKERRLEDKGRRSSIKRLRQAKPDLG